MGNEIPKSYDAVIEFLEDAADGAATHGAAVGLKQNTKPAIRADLVALVGKPAGPGGCAARRARLQGAPQHRQDQQDR